MWLLLAKIFFSSHFMFPAHHSAFHSNLTYSAAISSIFSYLENYLISQKYAPLSDSIYHTHQASERGPWRHYEWSEWSRSVVCDSLPPHGLYSPPVSSAHGIFQARILGWVTISFSRRSFWPRDWTWVSCIVGRRFTIWATREVTPIQLIDLNDLCKSLDSIYASE